MTAKICSTLAVVKETCLDDKCWYIYHGN